VKFRLRA